MIVADIGALARAVQPRQRLLGLDVGTKTIGLAISDSDFKVAVALETLRRTKFTVDAEALKKLIAERGVGGLVIGLPVGMDGSEGPAAQSVRQFAANLDARLGIPVAFWDERLSTAAVERFLVDEADASRAKRARIVDALAATYILQGALDSLQS